MFKRHAPLPAHELSATEQEARIFALHETIAQLTRERDALNQDIASQKADQESLRFEHQAEVTVLETKLSGLTQDIADIETAVSLTKSALSDLAAEKIVTEDIKNALTHDIGTLNLEKSTLERSIATLKADHASALAIFASDKVTYQAKEDELANKVGSLERKAEDLQTQITAKADALVAIEGNLCKTRENLGKAEYDLHEATTKATAMIEEARATSVALVSQAEAKVIELAESTVKTQIELESLKFEAEAIHEATKTKSAELYEREQTIIKREQALETAKHQATVDIIKLAEQKKVEKEKDQITKILSI